MRLRLARSDPSDPIKAGVPISSTQVSSLKRCLCCNRLAFLGVPSTYFETHGIHIHQSRNPKFLSETTSSHNDNIVREKYPY